MNLDWNMVIAAGSFGQFVVVFVAALVALWQLKHMRRQSELEASLSLLAWVRSAEYREAYPHVLEATDADSEVRFALARGDGSDPRAQKVLSFAHFLNEIGILVEQGLIKGSTVIPYYRDSIVVTWSLVMPFVARRRHQESESSFLAPLEALVLRAKAVSVDDRFSRIRRSLPRSLRADFDSSRSMTGASHTTDSCPDSDEELATQLSSPHC
jgi:hypothetical protein